MFAKLQKLFSPDDGASVGGDNGSLLSPEPDNSSLLGPAKVEEPLKEVIDTGNKQISSPENALEKEATKEVPKEEPVKKEPDKKESDKKEEPAPKAPEKYEDFKMPEGVKIDNTAIGKAVEKFKELDLTQEQAQSLIDIQTELAQGQTKQYQEMFEKTKNEWKQQTIKELGADYRQELAYGAKFRDQFLSPETVAFLDENGLLNHPAIVKDFIKAGKMMAEDKLVAEGKKGGEPSLGDIFYPNMKTK